MSMVDVHCHLNFEAFEKDYDAVIKRAFDAGVTTIINVGTKLDTSQKAVDLASKYDNLYAIVGIHPHHADKNDVILGTQSVSVEDSRIDSGQVEDAPRGTRMTIDTWLEELEKIALSSKKVLSIGEIGLDNYRYQSNGITDPKAQKELFLAQIELAHKLKLPLQIHNRHAGKEILDILEANKSLLLPDNPGMFHCFAGSQDILKRVLDLGFCVGFDGNITYKGLAPGEDTSLSELAAYAPLERIVIETDSPYLTPIPYRGGRNEPQYAILVGRKIAEIKGITQEEVDTHTTQNVKRIFQLDTKR